MSIPNRAIVLVLVLAACRDAQTPSHVQARTSPASQRTGTVADPLPSWNGSPAKTAIVQFVSNVTRAGGPFFVAPAERIAVFDNDGTLWVEQPMYAQLAFALDRVKQLAPTHPEWKTQQPFAGILAGDPNAITSSGEAGIAELVAQTHANTTTD